MTSKPSAPAKPVPPTAKSEQPQLTKPEQKELDQLEKMGHVPETEKGKPFYPLGSGSEVVPPKK